MNRQNLIYFLILLAGTFVSGYYGPWWSPAIFIVLVAILIELPTLQASATGALALGLVYAGMAIWMNAKDQTDLLDKTGQLLGGLSLVALVLLTTFIGALTGLLSGWLGNVLGNMLRKGL